MIKKPVFVSFVPTSRNELYICKSYIISYEEIVKLNPSQIEIRLLDYTTNNEDFKRSIAKSEINSCIIFNNVYNIDNISGNVLSLTISNNKLNNDAILPTFDRYNTIMVIGYFS